MPATVDIKAQVKAALLCVQALADAIRELGEVPAGHLYVAVMATIDHDTFERAIRLLVNAGIVRRSGDVLHWNVARAEAA